MRLSDERLQQIKEGCYRPGYSFGNETVLALVSELMESREALKWEAIARALYDLLDDCDTADDIAKENDAEFRRLVRKAHQSRFLYGRPDADGLAVHFGIDGKEDG